MVSRLAMDRLSSYGNKQMREVSYHLSSRFIWSVVDLGVSESGLWDLTDLSDQTMGITSWPDIIKSWDHFKKLLRVKKNQTCRRLLKLTSLHWYTVLECLIGYTQSLCNTDSGWCFGMAWHPAGVELQRFRLAVIIWLWMYAS